MAFAKLYGSDDDQILAVRDESDEGDPAITVTFDIAGLGRCTHSFIYHDEAKADEKFAELSEKELRKIVRKVSRGMKEQFGVS